MSFKTINRWAGNQLLAIPLFVPTIIAFHKFQDRMITDITQFESTAGASVVIAFLRWHKARNIDLSNARIDSFYVLYTGLMAMRDHAHDLADPSMREFAENLKKMSDKLEDTYSKEITKLTSQKKAQLEMELQQRLLPILRGGSSN